MQSVAAELAALVEREDLAETAAWLLAE